MLLLAWSLCLAVAEDKPDNSQLSRSSDGSAGGGGSDASRTDSKDIQEEVISMQVIEMLSFSILSFQVSDNTYLGGWQVVGSLLNNDFMVNNILQSICCCTKFYKLFAVVVGC